MLGLPDVRSCCGCLSIEVGAKIIVWVQLMTGGLFFVYCIEFLTAALLSERYSRSFVYKHTTINLVFCLYPIVQGTILFIGIKKKRAGILLIWLILAFIFEIFVSSLLLILYAIIFTMLGEHLLAAVFICICGIQIGESFFFIVIVSTCRNDILRRNALFDYGVLYTPNAVEILPPIRRKGLIPTNSQFDHAALDTPEDKPENVVVT